MSALMIARINVKDREKYGEYLAASKQLAGTYGAELVHVGETVRALNGDGDHEIVVIARFPGKEDIDTWFDSDAYQPLAVLRDEAAEMHMTSYQVTG